MSGKLQGKVAIVTGASKGIGASIAVHLGREGAAVVVNYSSSKQGADRVVGEITGAGGKAVAVQANLAKEADIRRTLIQRGLIKGIIGLPANLFYGTGIPACIVVIDKENAHARSGIFVVDASKGYLKDGNKNRLRAQDIHKIVDVFNRQIELPRYSRIFTNTSSANGTFDFTDDTSVDSAQRFYRAVSSP